MREYAQHVTRFEAITQTGETLAVEKLDKSTWRCQPCLQTIIISYDVYAWDLSVRGAHLDTFHGYFNGACVFMQVLGQEQQTCDLELLAPIGEQYSHWRIGSSLREKTAKRYGFGLYQADNYDDLIDHPVEMGDISIDSFKVAGVPHDLIISGQHRADRQRLCRDLQSICSGHVRLFGELPPMSRYVFLVAILEKSDGGLEHRHSCSLFCERQILLSQHHKQYVKFLGLCSHEYLHAWHVKRIKPAVFIPYQLEQESYTRQLWIFEGITSYYDDLNLLRSGLISLTQYLDLLAQTLTQVYRTQGRFKQSVAESSFDAWIRAYRPNENSPNATVSYYSKGAIIALGLDLILRQHSPINLDHIMQTLWKQHGKPLKGLEEGEFERLLQKCSGLDLSDFFQRYVYGCEDVPIAALLEFIGIECQLRSPNNSEDMGGGQWQENPQSTPSLGLRFSPKTNDTEIGYVYADGAAQSAGIAAKDQLLAIDGIKVSRQNLDKQLQHFKVGDSLTIHVFRGDTLRQFQLTLRAVANTCVLRQKQQITPAQQQAQQAWLENTYAPLS